MMDHSDEKLTGELIKEFHRLIMNNISDANKEWFHVVDYKLYPNEIGGMQTTSPGKEAEKMKALLAEYLSKPKVMIEDIADLHQQFENIHLFQNGNGRVGRVIMFKECLKNDILPFIIDELHKCYYYRGLKAYRSEKGYLLDTCRSAQDVYGSYVDYFFPSRKMGRRWIERQGNGIVLILRREG